MKFPHYPNGEPPNLRDVKACDSCKYMIYSLGGALRCTKFPRRTHMGERVTDTPVNFYNVCDAHEEKT